MGAFGLGVRVRGVSDLVHAWSAPARCSPPVLTPAWQTWTDVSCPGTEALGDISGHCPARDGGPLACSHQLGCCPDSWDESGTGARRGPPVSRAPCPGGEVLLGPPSSCTPPSLTSWSSAPWPPGIQQPLSRLGGSAQGVRGPAGLLRPAPSFCERGKQPQRGSATFSRARGL